MKSKNNTNEEIYYFKNETPCIAYFGFGTIQRRVLLPKVMYVLTNLKCFRKEEYAYTFELWHDDGYIGTYWVEKDVFEENAIADEQA